MNTTTHNPLIQRTIDGKKWYIRLVTMTGTHDFWNTEICAPRYFTTKKAVLEYVQQQMSMPNRVADAQGRIINDRRKPAQ